MPDLSPRCSVYMLSRVLDDPRYEGFAFEDDASVKERGEEDADLDITDDFAPDDLPTKGRAWTAPRLAGLWTPRKVVGRVRSFNDYPCVDLMVPAFSRRAIDALRGFLEPNGELLPLVSPVGEYYAYNATTVVDALDEDASDIDWLDQTLGVPFRINKYAFDCARLKGAPIFRIVQDTISVFVSQDFVDAATAVGLKGMDFKLVFPFEAVAAPKTPGKRKPRPPAPTMAQAVVVLLPTKKPKPTKTEEARIPAILDELDALLYGAGQSPDEYLGSLEGHEHAQGAFRLFLSCPDADKLADRLRDRVAALPWDGPLVVLKRYGHFHDPDCPEEIDFERAAP